MSNLSLLPTSMLESLGLGIVQQAVDAALGPGVLTLSDDANGISAGLKLSSGQTIDIDDLTVNAQGLSEPPVHRRSRCQSAQREPLGWLHDRADGL